MKKSTAKSSSKASAKGTANRLCAKRRHRMTAENTYHHPSKGEQCRACFREYMRGYMVDWRAEQKKPRRPARKASAAKRKSR